MFIFTDAILLRNELKKTVRLSKFCYFSQKSDLRSSINSLAFATHMQKVTFVISCKEIIKHKTGLVFMSTKHFSLICPAFRPHFQWVRNFAAFQLSQVFVWSSLSVLIDTFLHKQQKQGVNK